MTSSGRAVDDTEKRADRELRTERLPGFELFPCPAVHADLSALVCLAVADQDCAAPRVHVGLRKSERLADAQPSTPEHHDQRAKANAVLMTAGRTHDSNDFFEHPEPYDPSENPAEGSF